MENMKEKVMRFTNMKVKDLKSYLKENGITGYSKLKKAQLQDAVYDLMFGTQNPEPEKPTKKEEATLKVIKPETAQEEIWYEEMINTPLQPMALFGDNPFRKPSHWCYFVAHVQSEKNVLSKELNDELSAKMKTKYRKMCKYFHPDNLNTGDAEKFRLINEAWEDANIANKEWSEILQKKEEDKISEMTKKYKAVFRQVKLRDEYRWHLYIYDREKTDEFMDYKLILDEEIYWDTRVQPDGTYKVNIDNFKYRLNGLKEQGKITEGARRLAIKLAKKFNEMDIKKARKTA